MQTAKPLGKTYMAGISPCFFTHFPWKNWVYPDLTILVRRFQELVELQPDMIQIISWNGMDLVFSFDVDWGESHYIGTLQKEAGVPDGAEKWITGFNHEPWRDICRFYINAYKTGRFPEVKVGQ
jgi:glucan endo-1,3-alpha-glucosidase